MFFIEEALEDVVGDRESNLPAAATHMIVTMHWWWRGNKDMPNLGSEDRDPGIFLWNLIFLNAHMTL